MGVGAAMHMQWGGARRSTFGVHMHGGHVVPTTVAMHMQWGSARRSTFGVHMHVAPTVPTVLAAYACGFGVHMHVAPTAPTFSVCICMWLQRSQRSWLLMHVTPTALDAQARLVCICRA